MSLFLSIEGQDCPNITRKRYATTGVFIRMSAVEFSVWPKPKRRRFATSGVLVRMNAGLSVVSEFVR